MSEFLINGIFAAIAGLGFSYANKPPKQILIFCALFGGCGFMLRVLILANTINYALATFLSALCVGLVCVFVAQKLKTPIEILAFPSLLPMIPGLFAYKTVLAVFMFIKSEDEAKKIHYLVEIFDYGFTTISTMFALAIGISVALLVFYEKSFTMTRRKNFRNKYIKK
ncbi:threonine/serine exporter [Campylobacter sp. FMV-PI01]|uniref:Threonine/serine exporter n=1 Tax=Campylobacter portucalensis TaxID=2608384 RepID=A0A6L5WGX5_9BACT|nr:threonine/serine exporter family protein [Campylobacter portucalensis]MSN96086.1 threonine/serine exporter [Campylobacter portucalensis]